MMKFIKVIALFAFVLLLVPYQFSLAAAPSGGYSPGATLNPDCSAGDSDCTVDFTAEGLSSGSTAGSVMFSDGSNLLQDNSNLFWDNSNNRLGIGTNTPSTPLELVGDFTITGDFLPTADNTYSLGSATKQWQDVFIGPGSLYVNGQKVIEEELNNIIFSADVNQSVALRTTGTGDIELNPAGTGQLLLKANTELSGGKTITTSDGTNVLLPDGIQADGLIVDNNAITATELNAGIGITPNGTGDVYVTSGNFGVGDTGPAEKLSVSGNGAFTGTLSASNLSGTNTGDQDLSGYFDFATSTLDDITQGATNKFVTASDLTNLGNLSGTNTGDQDLSSLALKATTITAGTGLSGGGDLSTNRTIDLADTLVTPGVYTNADITVDQQGRITAASNGSSSSQWTTTGSDIYYTTGAVGIGANSPTYQLEVSTTADQAASIGFNSTLSPATGGGGVFIDNDNTTSSGLGGLVFRANDDGGTARHGASIVMGKETAWTSGSSYSSYMSFWTRNGTSNQAEAMRITSNGQVGINDTSPASGITLSVKGQVVLGRSATAGGDGIVSINKDTLLSDTPGLYFYAGDGASTPNDDIVFLDIGSNKFRVVGGLNGAGVTQWATISSSAGWQAGSSEAIKNNIEKLSDDEYNDIMTSFEATDIYTFERNDVPGVSEIGFIAERSPDSITSPEKDTIFTLKALGWLTAVTKKVWEKASLIDDLLNRVNNLESRIEELEKRLDVQPTVIYQTTTSPQTTTTEEETTTEEPTETTEETTTTGEEITTEEVFSEETTTTENTEEVAPTEETTTPEEAAWNGNPVNSTVGLIYKFLATLTPQY